MTLRTWAITTLFLACVSCGSDGGGSGAPPPGTAPTDSSSPGPAADTPATLDPGPADEDSGGPTEIDNDAFKILFTYEERFNNCSQDGDPDVRESDLVIIWPDGSHQTSVTQLSLKEAGETCKAGCFTDERMRWILVGRPVSQTGTFSFLLGRFNPQLQARIVKGDPIEGIIDFGFGGDMLFFSRLVGQDPGGPGGRYYSYTRVPLERPSELTAFLPEVPPAPEDRKGSTYQGHFTVDKPGKNIVYLNPSIGSQQIVHWSEGILNPLDLICPNEVSGQCITAGSRYSDTDPVAVDLNGENVFAVLQNDDALTIYKWNVKTHDRSFSNLLAMPPGGAYETSSCFNTTRAFPWVRVRQMEVAPDGQHLLLLVINDCSNLDKEQTDIIEIPTAAIGDGTALDEADIRNITRNPEGELAENVIITAFDVTPDGKALVFTGSPMLDSDGVTPLQHHDQRANKDRELYVAPTDGSGRKQLSNDICFEARGPRVVVPDGKPAEW